MNNMSGQLSPEERLEKAFREGEFDCVEDVYNIDDWQPVEEKTETVGGEMGELFGESLCADDSPPPDAPHRIADEDAFQEEFFHE